MGILTLMRHGKSMWNLDPTKPDMDWAYAGAVDVPLSESGITDAINAGKTLQNVDLDLVYCSMLTRAQTTALIALAFLGNEKVPLIVRDTDASQKDKRGIRAHKRKIHKGKHQDILPMYCSFDLNERSFGNIQGMFKTEQQKHFTEDELVRFRTEWSTPFPGGESSASVYDRTIRFFKRHIEQQLLAGKNVLVVCHGFVVRVLIAYLNNLTPVQWKEAMVLESRHEKSILSVPNAKPVFYRYEEDCVEQITLDSQQQAKL